jgi:hypothetical protein
MKLKERREPIIPNEFTIKVGRCKGRLLRTLHKITQ